MPGWPASRVGLKRCHAWKRVKSRLVNMKWYCFTSSTRSRLALRSRSAAQRYCDGSKPGAKRLAVRSKKAAFVGIAENFVERRVAELVARESPGDLGGEAVGVQFVVGDVDSS